MKRYLEQSIRRAAAGLTCLLLVCAASGCGAGSFSHEPFLQASLSDGTEEWDEAEYTVVLENGRIRFELDPDTTHFTLTDLRSGTAYFSAAPEYVQTFSNEQKYRMTSELSIVYYNSDSAEFVMTSAGDSVEKGLHHVYVKDGAVRVAYEFGETAALLAPPVMTVEMFEGTLCNPDTVDSGVIRRISRYYTLFSPEDAGDEDYEEALQRFPLLAERALYVQRDTVDTLKMMEISDACENAGITAEQIAAMLQELGIEQQEEDGPGFDLTVEYALTEDGFTAELLTDQIREHSPDYHLQKAHLLEYFACSDEGDEGSFLVPDGSGALIPFGRKTGVYSQPVYGADAAIQREFQTQLSADVLMPLLAINRFDGTVLAMAESGEATASVRAVTASLTDPVNHAGFFFALRALDVTDIGVARNIPTYNLYGKHIQYAHPKVRYVLFPAGAELTDLAAFVRETYIREGRLPEQTEDPSGWLLQFSCVMTEPATFLGVPYTRKTALSECGQIRSFLTDLGLEGLTVRLTGYGGQGLAHGVNDEFALHRLFGSEEDLTALCGAAAGRVYLDADFATVLTDTLFDGYSVRGDTAKYINRTLVQKQAYDIVTRQYQDSAYDAYLVSPTLYGEIAQGFLSSLKEQSFSDKVGLSYPSAGSLLLGDYTPGRDLDRAMSQQLVEQTLQKAGGSYSLMTEKGYLYALADCGIVCGMPLDSSSFDLESESVPFYQMVVHGSLSYFGVPYNQSADRRRLLLRSLEYGAGISWSLITGDEMNISSTDYETANYSVQAADNREEIETLYRELNDFMQATARARITGHRQVEDGVYLTEYSGSAAVAVNYGDKDAQVNGKTVKAGGYAIWLP